MRLPAISGRVGRACALCSLSMGFSSYLIYVALAYTRVIELFAPELMAYRPMVVLWLVAFATGVVHAARGPGVAASGRHLWMLAMLVLGIAMSLLVSDGVGAAMAGVGQFSAAAMMFVLTVLHATSLRRLLIACGVILASTFFLALASFASFQYGFMVDQLIVRQPISMELIKSTDEVFSIPAMDQSGLYMYRVHGVGFFDDPNDFAQAIVSVLPWLWWFYRPGRWVRNVFLIFMPGALLGYVIYLTHSRGALLGIASVMFFGVRNALGTTRTALVIAMLAAIASMGSFTGGRGFSSSGDESAAGRIQAWVEGLAMLGSSPIFGVGFGNFLNYNILTAHNSFVLCFAELGYFGFFCWISLIVLAYKAVNSVVQHAPESADARKAAFLLRSSLLGFMTCAWFLSRTYQPTLYVLLALCVACWHAAQREMPEPSGALMRPTPWVGTAVAVMVAAIFLVRVFIFMHYSGHG